jgi:hypothetical protein
MYRTLDRLDIPEHDLTEKKTLFLEKLVVVCKDGKRCHLFI